MIVSFVSKKGGVGKTTSSVSVAAALAFLGHRTLLVDLDSQASASLSFGVSREDLAPSAYDLLFGKLPAAAVVRQTPHPRLDLITASVDLVSADVELAPLRDRELALRRRMEPLRDAYDWILFDCPPTLSVVPLGALAASDGFVVPVPPQPLATDGIELLLEAAERLRVRFGFGPRLFGLLPTMVDYRTRLARSTVAWMRERYGDRVFAAEVNVNVRLAELPGAGRDIFDLDPAARGARAYLAVATELVQRARGESPLPPSPASAAPDESARPTVAPPAAAPPAAAEQIALLSADETSGRSLVEPPTAEPAAGES
ncbi:MAG: ParA family protein [Holophagales bacterium]|nr:MAG: ParA family protein [Holophagales bacterium]